MGNGESAPAYTVSYTVPQPKHFAEALAPAHPQPEDGSSDGAASDGAVAWPTADIFGADGHTVIASVPLTSPRPHFLADAQDIPASTLCLQRTDPAAWALTIGQLQQLVGFMRATPEFAAVEAAKGYVSLGDIDALFVRPWTHGTGCGIALLMNARAPMRTQLFVSHSWAGGVVDCSEALGCWAARAQRAWAGESGGESIPLWLSTFAVYQPGDGVGPSLQQQLSLRPLQAVIAAIPRFGAVILHTRHADPYERLWVLHEIDEFLEVGLICRSIGEFFFGSGPVFARDARCGSSEDSDMIRAIVEQKGGGHERLDAVVGRFRSSLFQQGVRIVQRFEVAFGSGFQEALDRARLVLAKAAAELGAVAEQVAANISATDAMGLAVDPSALAAVDVSRWPLNVEVDVQLESMRLPTLCDDGELVVRHIPDRIAGRLLISGQAQWWAGTCRDFLTRVSCELRDWRATNENGMRFGVALSDSGVPDFSRLKVLLEGPIGTPYENGIFLLDIRLPREFPFCPPRIVFETPIFHPNICGAGRVGLDILNCQWDPTVRLPQVLHNILELLAAPGFDRCREPEAAALFRADPLLFEDHARQHAGQHAVRSTVEQAFCSLTVGATTTAQGAESHLMETCSDLVTLNVEPADSRQVEAWEVVYDGPAGVRVRSAMSLSSKILGVHSLGVVVYGRQVGEWFCLVGEPGFMLIQRDDGVLHLRAASGGPLPWVCLRACGVLGLQQLWGGQQRRIEDEPSSEVVIVDSAKLRCIQGSPGSASVAARQLYEWLGIVEDATFPEAVRVAIQEPLVAKLHSYMQIRCIHVVGPNFRERPCSMSEAVEQLSAAYSAVLSEFLMSGCRVLRLAPLSTGVWAGSFASELSSMTVQALQRSFQLLGPAEQLCLQRSRRVELCVFAESELPDFEEAFVERLDTRDAQNLGPVQSGPSTADAPNPRLVAPDAQEEAFDESGPGTTDAPATTAPSLSVTGTLQEPGPVQGGGALGWPRPGGLEVEFVAGGATSTVIFEHRPLGLDFMREPPFEVVGVTGYAEELGVKAGWVMARVGLVHLQAQSDIEATVAQVMALPEAWQCERLPEWRS